MHSNLAECRNFKTAEQLEERMRYKEHVFRLVGMCKEEAQDIVKSRRGDEEWLSALTGFLSTAVVVKRDDKYLIRVRVQPEELPEVFFENEPLFGWEFALLSKVFNDIGVTSDEDAPIVVTAFRVLAVAIWQESRVAKPPEAFSIVKFVRDVQVCDDSRNQILSFCLQSIVQAREHGGVLVDLDAKTGVAIKRDGTEAEAVCL